MLNLKVTSISNRFNLLPDTRIAVDSIAYGTAVAIICLAAIKILSVVLDRCNSKEMSNGIKKLKKRIRRRRKLGGTFRGIRDRTLKFIREGNYFNSSYNSFNSRGITQSQSKVTEHEARELENLAALSSNDLGSIEQLNAALEAEGAHPDALLTTPESDRAFESFGGLFRSSSVEI